MKRTGIFALAGACALGVTALVGGVGYASALDVAEQAGQTLDVPGVSTVERTSDEVSDSTTLKDKSTPTPDPTDPATDAPVAEAPVDDGTVDQGSGDAVDEVDPSDPVVIPDDGVRDPADVKGCGKGDHDGDWGDKADDGVVDPAEGDGSWTGDRDWTQKDGQWTGDPAPAPAPADPNAGDGSDHNWQGGNRDGGDRSDRGGGDRSDRGGDRGQRGGGHGHGGGGHHGGRG